MTPLFFLFSFPVYSQIHPQTSSFKRYEISWVHRRAVGHSTPYRFLQGDFDIVGGASPIPEAEIIKVAYLHMTSCLVFLL